VLGAKPLDLIELDVGLLSVRYGGAGNPPVGAGQPGRQIGSGSGRSMLLGAAGMRSNLTVCRLPEPDTARFLS